MTVQTSHTFEAYNVNATACFINLCLSMQNDSVRTGCGLYRGACHGLEFKNKEKILDELRKDLDCIYTEIITGSAKGVRDSEEFVFYKRKSILSNEVAVAVIVTFTNSNHKCDMRYLVSNGSRKSAKYLEKLFYIERELLTHRVDSNVMAIVSTPNGITANPISFSATPFQEDNYQTDVVEWFRYTSRELRSENPTGRLYVLSGPPGTGKTYLIKGLCTELSEYKLLILMPNDIENVSKPEMLSLLIEEKEDSKPLILIVEDADRILSIRDGGNIGAMSVLLNLTDGILGNALDIRIICSTNAESVDLDPALKRPGRLASSLRVEPLSCDKANSLFRKLGGEGFSFNKPKVRLSEVYGKISDSKAMNSKDKPKKIGF